MKYTPPTCFLGFQKKWGGSFGCHILAQRWYCTPFHFRRTYIHIYMHACIQPGPGETIINQIFLAEIFSRCGAGGTPPLFEIFQFLPPPHPPLKGGYIYIYVYINITVTYTHIYIYIICTCVCVCICCICICICACTMNHSVSFSPWQRLTPQLRWFDGRKFDVENNSNDTTTTTTTVESWELNRVGMPSIPQQTVRLLHCGPLSYELF